MKGSQISKERGKREAKYQDCRLENFIKTASDGRLHISLFPSNESLPISLYKVKHNNGNPGPPLSLVYLRFQPCYKQGSLNFLKE